MATTVNAPSRTSLLAGLCFLSGVGAVACVTTAWFLYQLAGLDGISGNVDRKDLLLASHIVAWCTIGPAVLALTLWLGARAAVKEGRGEVGGRGLYRAGLLVSTISVVMALVDTGSVHAKAKTLADRIGQAALEVEHEVRLAQAKRGWLGVETRDVRGNAGARVTRIVEGSPAEKAGIKVGDVIVAVGRAEIGDADDLSDEIRERRPGDEVTLTVKREGDPKPMEIKARLASRYPELLEGEPDGLGVSGVRHLAIGMAGRTWGLRVTAVQPDSPAVKAGLRMDDVIFEVAGENVDTPDKLAQIMKKVRAGTQIRVNFGRDGKEMSVDVVVAPR